MSTEKILFLLGITVLDEVRVNSEEVKVESCIVKVDTTKSEW